MTLKFNPSPVGVQYGSPLEISPGTPRYPGHSIWRNRKFPCNSLTHALLRKHASLFKTKYKWDAVLSSYRTRLPHGDNYRASAELHFNSHRGDGNRICKRSKYAA